MPSWSLRNLSGWELPLLTLLLFLGFAFWLIPAQCRSKTGYGLHEGAAVGGGACTLFNLPMELVDATYHGCPAVPVGRSASIRNAAQITVLYAVFDGSGSCGLEGAMAEGGMARVGGPQFSLECAPGGAGPGERNSSTPLVLMKELSPRNAVERVRLLCGGTCKVAFWGTRASELCEEESYWVTWLLFGVLVFLFLLLAVYVQLRGCGYCAGPNACCCCCCCCQCYIDDGSGDPPEWHSYDRRSAAGYGARALPPLPGLGHTWRRDVRRTLHTVRDIERSMCEADLRKRWHQHGSDPNGARGGAAAGGKVCHPVTMLCAICLVEDEPEEPVLVHEVLPCGHIFHAQCIQHWRHVSLSCPLCREAMQSAHVFVRTAVVREI